MTEKKIAFITTPEVVSTGTCSFAFMTVVDDEFFREIAPISRKWGFIAARTKDADEFQPFVWAENQRKDLHPGDEGYQQCLGDDGVLRLDAHLFESSKGFLLGSGIDFDFRHELERMKTTIERFPSCVVLLPASLYTLAEQAAKDLGFEVVAYHHDKPLETG